MTHEEVMEQIKNHIDYLINSAIYTTVEYPQDMPWEQLQNAILSIHVNGKTIEELIEDWVSGKLRKLDLDQILPANPYQEEGTELQARVFAEGVEALLKENWVKVIPK